MALKALNINSVWDYVSRLDPDKGVEGGSPTVFTLRVLDSFVMGRVNDQVTEFDATGVDPDDPDGQVGMKTRVNMNAAAVDACRFGIVDIKNWQNDDGSPRPFNSRRLTLPGGRVYRVAEDSVLERLPNAILNELFQELQRQNTVSETEEKNSDGSSPPSNTSPSGSAKVAPTTKSGSGDATPASSKAKTGD